MRTAALAILVLAGGCSAAPETPAPLAQAPATSPALSEAAKAQAEPYANDLGPDSLPAGTLASYPKDVSDGYAVMAKKCSACHSAARPLNSQFVEAGDSTDEARQHAVAQLKRTDPLLFSDENIWRIESDIWKRYTKRMMAKPGCDIAAEEGKLIHAFLAHDSRARKLGANRSAWKTHREGLLARFKREQPERHKILYGEQE